MAANGDNVLRPTFTAETTRVDLFRLVAFGLGFLVGYYFSKG